MRRILLSTAAVALMSGAAFAADMPAFEPAPIMAPVPVGYDWSGFYVGLQAGYVWGDAEADFDNGAPSLDLDPDGWKLGGHAGYNFQWNWLVLGVEGDIEWADVNGSDSSTAGITSESEIDVNWQASLRGRLGVGINRVHIYGTGGAAFADVDVDGGPLVVGDPCCGFDDSGWGWTAGVGGEFAVTQRFILGVEYRYTDYGEFDGGLAPTFPAVTESVELQTHTVRGRASLKF